MGRVWLSALWWVISNVLANQGKAAMALHVATKVVVKRPKGRPVKRYRYYQLVKSYHRKGLVRTKYVCYLGKEPCLSQQKAREVGLTPEELEGVEGLNVLANQGQEPASVEVAADSNRNQDLLPLNVVANQRRDREEHDPFVPPEKRPTVAVCARCGGEFVLTWFERHLGHALCGRCRVEVLKEKER